MVRQRRCIPHRLLAVILRFPHLSPANGTHDPAASETRSHSLFFSSFFRRFANLSGMCGTVKEWGRGWARRGLHVVARLLLLDVDASTLRAHTHTRARPSTQKGERNTQATPPLPAVVHALHYRHLSSSPYASLCSFPSSLHPTPGHQQLWFAWHTSALLSLHLLRARVPCACVLLLGSQRQSLKRKKKEIECPARSQPARMMRGGRFSGHPNYSGMRAHG